jgi:predicted Zn-dependent protease
MQQDTSQRVFKAQQLLKANNLPTAIEELKAEVAQHPDNDVALSSLAECYLNSANFAEAKTTVEALLKISPENATAYYMKGLAQAQLGDLNGATNSLQTCLKIAPEFSQALELLKQIRGQRR